MREVSLRPSRGSKPKKNYYNPPPIPSSKRPWTCNRPEKKTMIRYLSSKRRTTSSRSSQSIVLIQTSRRSKCQKLTVPVNTFPWTSLLGRTRAARGVRRVLRPSARCWGIASVALGLVARLSRNSTSTIVEELIRVSGLPMRTIRHRLGMKIGFKESDQQQRWVRPLTSTVTVLQTSTSLWSTLKKAALQRWNSSSLPATVC